MQDMLSMSVGGKNARHLHTNIAAELERVTPPWHAGGESCFLPHYHCEHEISARVVISHTRGQPSR